MPELIDKAKLIEYLSAIKPDEYVSAYGEAAVDVINHVEKYVAEMPTIDPEVRHGHWIFREEATPEYLPWDMWCSCCGEYHDSDDYNDRYCSKCGAKMDGGADNAG